MSAERLAMLNELAKACEAAARAYERVSIFQSDEQKAQRTQADWDTFGDACDLRDDLRRRFFAG